MNADQVRAMLRKEAERRGSQRALARAIGVSAAFLGDVLLGRREPSGALLDFLGIERVVTYKVRYERIAK